MFTKLTKMIVEVDVVLLWCKYRQMTQVSGKHLSVKGQQKKQ